ncbi:MAG: DUF2442 domain-containing protein [Candidatus Omnitrophica bacterium]|nr:DUF2442 domain-containing protein [Candidatus Omnitrophota bacterium]
MKLLKNGKNISKVEITNISEHGFWVLLQGKEYFLSFDKYPWFKNATIDSIVNVTVFHNHHLYWPKLDVDLSTEILNAPERYPLTYK